MSGPRLREGDSVRLGPRMRYSGPSLILGSLPVYGSLPVGKCDIDQPCAD